LCVAILKDVFNTIYPCNTWFYIMPLGNRHGIHWSDFFTFVWFSIIQGLSKTSFFFFLIFGG
jgi:hypothetical protein